MKWHGDQQYGGHPYVYHLDMVYDVLVEFNYVSVEYLKAAYCHDLLEDTKVSPREILRVTESATILNMVWAVTAEGATRAEKTSDTISKLKLVPYAVPLKMADRLANMRFSSQNSRKHINRYIDELSKYSEVFYGPMYQEMLSFKKVPE